MEVVTGTNVPRRVDTEASRNEIVLRLSATPAGRHDTSIPVSFAMMTFRAAA